MQGEPSDFPPTGLTAIGPVDTERKVRHHSLVLQSMSLWHMTRPGLGGWIILVRDQDYRRAARAIDRYEEENKDWPPPKWRDRLRYPASSTFVLVMSAMVLFFLVTGPVRGGSEWFAAGRSDSSLVLFEEPWRVVTALTLHADGPHVIGNAISGVVFGSAVQRRLGPGGGALAILASGAVGNFANAVYYHLEGLHHRSIGASTAMMGAIGILAASQVFALRRAPKNAKRKWFDYLVPIVGGFALLGAIGASPDSDLGAHGFGLGAGLLVGAVAGVLQRHTTPGPSEGRGQVVLGALATGIVLGCWQLALP